MLLLRLFPQTLHNLLRDPLVVKQLVIVPSGFQLLLPGRDQIAPLARGHIHRPRGLHRPIESVLPDPQLLVISFDGALALLEIFVDLQQLVEIDVIFADADLVSFHLECVFDVLDD